MLTNKEKRNRFLKTIAVYVAVIIAAAAFNSYRLRTQAQAEQIAARAFEPVRAEADTRPFFSLLTNRTYGTKDRARLWINYKNVDHLDFRVYRVKDPLAFFKKLEDPHQIGEDEKGQLAKKYKGGASLLERTRALKSWLYSSIKLYVRDQLKRESRKTFNAKFRKSDSEPARTPLNHADYARVPLLNSDQLVSSWREKLSPIDQYDRRMIPMGKREPGVYLVEAVNAEMRAYGIVIVTDLAMINKTSRDGEILVSVVDRNTGAPNPGVQVEIIKRNLVLASGLTDTQGILKTKVQKKRPGEMTQHAQAEADDDETPDSTGSYLIMASSREQFAISDLDSFYFSPFTFDGEETDTNLRGYIYTDRPVYRPEQKVYFKGILRHWTANGYQLPEEPSVTVTIEDPNGGKLYQRDLQLSSNGTFSGEVDISAEAPLGSYHITANAGSGSATAYFMVEEYKKPEYKVKVTTPQKFVSVGRSVKFTIDARYFFGAPVADAEVKYYIYRSRYYHWWWRDSDATDEDFGVNDYQDDGEGYYYGYGDNMMDEGDARLDPNGRLVVEFEVPEPEENDKWDYTYRLEAQVTDSARRTIQGSASFTATRGSVVAYAHPQRYVYYEGDKARIKVRTADYQGRPVSTAVTLKFLERRWEKVAKKTEDGYEYTDYVLHERELSTPTVNTDAQGDALYEYPVTAPGYLSVKAIVRDGRKEIVSEGSSFWATDRAGLWSDFGYRSFYESSIHLIPDKRSYKPGETARVLVMLPEEKVHLLVTTELTNVMTAKQIFAGGRSVMIDVPIESRYAPNVYLSVSYVKDNDMYTNDTVLVVPAREKMLDIEVISNKQEYQPRQTASYTIVARDADGTPAAGAEVSLGVVDEAIYSIQPEIAGSIRNTFYGRRYNEIETRLSLSYNFIGFAGDQPVNLAQKKPSYQLADFKNETEFVEPAIRKEFKDTAFWQPDVITGPDGKATVTVKLPDNLTTWRTTARAVTADTRVGSTVQKVLSRKDVIMRLETPRFLTQGDTVTISGIVHNFLKTDKPTRISIDVKGAQMIGSAIDTVNIKHNGVHRVDWQISAQQTGELRLLAKALTDTESDAVELSIPIVPRGLKETLGGSTTISADNADEIFNLDAPANSDPNSLALRIEAAPSVASTLFGALDYLTGYPYGCVEQTMSQFLPTVIVAQTLQNVAIASIRDSNDISRKVQRGLDRLYGFQHSDGGWGWWRDDPTDPYMTAYVVNGLMMAKAAGVQIEDWRIDRGRAKLTSLLQSGRNDHYNTEIDQETRAFMIYTLSQSGGADDRFVNEFFNKRARLQPYGRALLALTLKHRGDDARATVVASEIKQSAIVNNYFAHWPSKRRPMLDFSEENSIEATALSLKALTQISPQSSLLPKVARWLVTNRRSGSYWNSTKDTAFAIFALTDYLKISQELSPNYTVEIYLNGERVLSHRVTAQDAASGQRFVIDRKAGTLSLANQVRVVKRGRGMLYLSTTLSYHSGEDEVAAQSSKDLKITREYFKLRVTDAQYGKRWKIEPLSGEIRSGDLLVVRLRIEGAKAQYLMVEDPIAAGFEQVARVGALNLNYTDSEWCDWFSAREFRDQKTVFFLTNFQGKATFQYAIRAQAPGEFRIAPARVERMYDPSVRANTASASLSILEKDQ